MAATSSSFPPASENPSQELMKKARSHEIAIAELSSLGISKDVYQRNGIIFFRRDIKTAIAFERKQLDTVKAQLQKINTA